MATQKRAEIAGDDKMLEQACAGFGAVSGLLMNMLRRLRELEEEVRELKEPDR